MHPLNLNLKKRKKNKYTAIIVVIFASILVISATSATILTNQESKSNPKNIWISQTTNENGENPYQAISGDYSGTLENKTVTSVDPMHFSRSASTEIGKWNNNTQKSDGKYMSVITEKSVSNMHRTFSINGQEINYATTDKFLDDEGLTTNNSIMRVAYQDNQGIKTVAVTNQNEEFSTISQTYRLRGSCLPLYEHLSGGDGDIYQNFRDADLSIEEWTNVNNFHLHGGYPTYIKNLTFDIRLKFGSLANRQTATPRSYRVELYNYLMDKWDTVRIENTSNIQTYTQGIYQDDVIELTRQNINFEPYFNPDDRLTMNMRISLDFSERFYPFGQSGVYQELNIDKIGYHGYSEYYLMDFSKYLQIPFDLQELDFRSDPNILLECKSNATQVLPDDVIYSSFSNIFGMGYESNIPSGPYDKGIKHTSHGNLFIYMYQITILTSRPIRVDFDWIQDTYYPEYEDSIPNKWYANESEFINIMGDITDITCEFNITATPDKLNSTINLAEDFHIKSIITPNGYDATEVFDFSNNFVLDTRVTNAFGYGKYQIITNSPNYITHSSITDGSYTPINETTYDNRVKHRTIIKDFEKLSNEQKLGSIEVSFITEKKGVIYSNITSTENPNIPRGFFTGESDFSGSSVGVVDCLYVWSNGENIGVYSSQFAMLGSGNEKPFIKIFTPDDGSRVNEEKYLYVAVVSLNSEQESFSLDGSLNYDPLTKGTLESIKGVSRILKNYLHYTSIPADELEHNTNHFMTVRALNSINGKVATEEVSMRVDKRSQILINDIAESYDDIPTPINISVDPDVVQMNIYLDNELIGRFSGDGIKERLRIPKLDSGTYFLDIKVWDDLGNYGIDSATFFVNQRNPTILGTFFQWIGDFFKILSVMLISIFGGLGIVVYSKKRLRQGKNDICPSGQKMINGKCEGFKNEKK